MKKILSLFFMLIIVMGATHVVSAADYVYSASVDGELSLHISPDEKSYKITSVPACSKMKIIKKERTWGLVVFNKKSGWINLSFTRNSYNDAAEATGNSVAKNTEIVVKENQVNLYSVPSDSEKLGSKIKYTVPKGLVLRIKRETPSGWGLVTMNGKYAWVQMKDTQGYEKTDAHSQQFTIYYVYALSKGGEGISLWDKAGGSNLCAVIPDCTKLTVREEKGNFGYVSYDGINGWIDLKHTASSLENAQMNAGISVNVEHEIKPGEDSDSVDIFSVPSFNPSDGAVVTGSVKEAEIVYILRTTLSGWSLINYNGVLGWLPPESSVVSEKVAENTITVLDKQNVGYAAVKGKNAVELYSDVDGKTVVAKLPQCVKIDIIAHQNGYDYVYCDYASGWALSSEIAATYDEAVQINVKDKKSGYITMEETSFMSVPTYSELCVSEQIAMLSENVYFEVVGQVVLQEKTWGLAQIDGKWGWINLEYAQSTKINIQLLIVILAGIAVILIAVVVILYVLKKTKAKKGKKTNKKEIDENEAGKGLLNDCGRACKETADVSGE